ncbi:MAG: S-layer homology domain-containing protein, partial [Lachnospiraceae bacterium]|nr:S-layer homology domain-containing protein [Lachnospiraceae bacterium]
VGTKWSEDSNVVKIRRNHFTDVPDDASYFDKLVWAVNNGIISGSSATTFSPDNACTRYQFCVMLYKMMGRPDVDENATLPFTDVAENASYRKAVTWAYTNKIISGTSKTTFSPDAEVTRYQVVAVLYKLAGKPAIGDAENPFTDVKKSDSYYNAVMWAVQNKITGGTSKTTFSPKDTCKRYQMTVFLYKYYNLMN